MKFNGLLLLPILLIAIIVFTNKPKSTPVEFTSHVMYASVHDSLPPSFLKQVSLHEKQGYVVSKGFKNTYYFEYTANHSQVIKALSSLPFAIDSVRADIQCRIISSEQELKGVSNLLAQQNYFSAEINKYTVYECLKAPQHHVVLLNKESDQVIHIMRQV
jgi:hypothetical protein